MASAAMPYLAAEPRCGPAAAATMSAARSAGSAPVTADARRPRCAESRPATAPPAAAPTRNLARADSDAASATRGDGTTAETRSSSRLDVLKTDLTARHELAIF